MKLQIHTSRKFFIRRLWNQCLDEVFPDDLPRCCMCQKPLPTVNWKDGYQAQEELDLDFYEMIRKMCPFCIQEAKGVRLANRIKRLKIESEDKVSVVAVVCATEYTGFVRTAMRHFKYDGMIELVPWFTDTLNKAAQLRHLFSQTDCIIHVPTSSDRIKKRGYDQAFLLSRFLSKAAKIPHFSVLRRSIDTNAFTQSQTAKNAHQRRSSLAGNFHYMPETTIKEKQVLLIDDVMTTGATMEICSRLLLKAGAASVTGLVVAYVP